MRNGIIIKPKNFNISLSTYRSITLLFNITVLHADTSKFDTQISISTNSFGVVSFDSNNKLDFTIY